MRFLITLALLSCAPLAAASPVERPNIVLIIGDDQGWPYHGFADSPQELGTTSGPTPVHDIVSTPNLDTLAAGGALFRNGYTTAPVCQPSLQTLLSASGLYPEEWATRRLALTTTGIGPIPYRGEVQYYRTVPRELQRYGYLSWEGGKMWEGNFEDAGFTHGLAVDRHHTIFGIDGVNFGRDDWDTATCGSTGDATPCPALDPLRDFLDEAGTDPFFVWFAPLLPHAPEDAPQIYKDELLAQGLLHYEANYLANVRWFDELVGELILELENRSLRDDTLIIYLSDNGWGLGFQFQGGTGKGKGTPYDIGSRTPFIFSWPGRITPAEYPDLVVASDIPATILSFANAARQPPEAVGIDLRARVEGGGPIGRAEIVQHYGGNDTVLAPPWRYIRHDDGTEELYEIGIDPFEENDVAGDHPSTVAMHRAIAEDHLAALYVPPVRTEIVGRVTNAGSPIAGGQLRFGSEIVSTDTNGWFAIGPLEPNTDRLRRHRRMGPLSWQQSFLYASVPFGGGGLYLPIEAQAKGKQLTEASGRVQGIVSDSVTSAPLPGVEIKLKGAPTSVRTVSGPDGQYLFEGLPPRLYKLRAKLSGYRGAKIRDIEVLPGDELVALPVALEPK